MEDHALTLRDEQVADRRPLLMTESCLDGTCAHHWIVASPDQGPSYTDALLHRITPAYCRVCGASREYRAYALDDDDSQSERLKPTVHGPQHVSEQRTKVA